jgi:HlyD family secretion protein
LRLFTLLRRHPVIASGSLVLLGLLIWGFWPQPVLVETLPVSRGPLSVDIEEEGRTRVIDRYDISAPVDGVACNIKLDVGDPVSKGQVLLTIAPLASQVLDPRSRAEAESRVAAAKAALASARSDALAAKARADFHAAEIKRLTPLAAQGVISHEALDRANMDATAARAAMRAAQHSVQVARYNLQAAQSVLAFSAAKPEGKPAELVPVRSPIDGRVLKAPKDCEGPVRTGEPLLEVGDPAALEVEVDVLSADAVRIHPGTRVYFDRWGGEGPLEGEVRTVEPVGFTKISALGVEEQRVLVIADFTSPHQRWARLGDGYRVDARFVLWQGDQVLQVPESSLFRHDGGWAVFLMQDDRAVLRTIKVGWRNGLAAQVLDGLQPGQRVISHPSDQVADGRRVRSR